MIVTVALNPAWDVTHQVDALQVGGTNRVRRVLGRAGGKAVNAARVLTALGEDVRVVAPVGGRTGEAFADELAGAVVDAVLVPIGGQTRRTIAVVAPGETTSLNEPGPQLTAPEWSALLGAVDAALVGADVLVVSGSLPPGVPVDACAELVELARRRGAVAVVDADGPPLLAALAARPAVVKPNAPELLAATGEADPLVAARTLAARTRGAVVASLGEAGLVAITPAGSWRARPPRVLAGNPTGAGDALVACLARGLARAGGGAVDWSPVLREGVAWSASAVVCERAGDVDPATHAELAPLVVVEELTSPPANPGDPP